MAEYLAPDVYVEEIDTGSKPIEGVSTSTAGVVGVTERGPAHVPILITSYGEFTRWFGGQLDPRDFVGPAGANDLHCFLPHAVEGFFTNGGKRLYVTRVESAGADRALGELHDRGAPGGASTWLLRTAPEGSGGAAAPAYVVDIAGLAALNRVRVGGGSESEYLDVANVSPATHVAMHFPLARAHAAGAVHAFAIVPGNVATLNANVAAGVATIDVVLAAAGDFAPNDLLEIGSNTALQAEYRYAIAVTPLPGPPANLVRVTLDSPLHVAHAQGVSVTELTLPAVPPPPLPAANTAALAVDALPRASVAYLTAAPPATFAAGAVAIFDFAGANREARRIGSLGVFGLAAVSYATYDTGAVVDGITLAPGAATATLGASVAGSNVVALADRTGFVVGTVLRFGGVAPFEFVRVTSVPNPGGSAPDRGRIVLAHGLGRAYPNGTPAVIVTVAVDPARPSSSLAIAAPGGAGRVVVADGNGYVAGDVVRVSTPDGAVYYHALSAAAAAAARPVDFARPFTRPHAAGSPLAERAPVLHVEALDTGAWGNRLRVSVLDEEPGLTADAPVVAAIAPNRIRLGSAAGVEAGTVLALHPPAGGAPLTTIKVQAIHRATAEVTLDPAAGLLTPADIVALGGGGFTARSREFRLVVRLLAAPDPNIPGSGERVIAQEDFRNLSLDPRHNRYVERVVGAIGGPLRLSDHRPDGESSYVRVTDLTPSAQIRLGPEALTDLLADGRREPARHALEAVVGDDSMFTLTDATYVGVDSADPEGRTGLFSLRNIEDISIVAIPGRTSTPIQNALINHCELARYRFAVLDAHRPPRDAIADVVNQRQQYDTKYAALYHPWLLISPPFPASAAEPDEYPIPPSGHMLGVYARTDIERGVHKAPANEVVRGVVGLQRLLNKGEHDILNPYPININVIRDFRANSRGIRAYGGRVITSDSDWKYVNVRRLLIFIEASINRGLQWVVFEPNAEPLWARVRRSIANFLTLVWRNGALEGTKVEEAFFVKCDRTTMTQTDIDSGRLICVVGVAPVKPAEFVIVRIGLWTAHADD